MSKLGKASERLLQRIAAGGAHAAPDGAALRDLLGAGLIERQGAGLALTEEGRARLARSRHPAHAHLAQHAELERRTLAAGDDVASVLVNATESPLAWLAKRKGKDGKPLLSAACVQAGERFRAHVTLARTMPRVTTNWSDPMGRAGKAPGGVADLTDAVLAARQKVRQALDAVGPELSGVLLDVCGFLKGLEDVERERGWPPRTAKVVLGLALQRLAGHYGLGEMARGRSRQGEIRHWRATADSDGTG